MKIPFIGPFSEERSRDVDYQTTINWYLEQSKRGKGSLVLYPTPGSKQFGIAGLGPIRGTIVFNNLLYVVSGNTLYEVNTGGGATSRGTLNTQGGRISMAHNGAANGQQIIIVDGTNGYIWDDNASTFSTIGDADFSDTATHVRFIDGYFVVNDPSTTGRFYISKLYDGTVWNRLDFATAERDPDALQAIEVSGRELWLLGENTTEVWANTGQADFPFEPIQSAFIEWGCSAPFSVAEADGAVFWLTQTTEGDDLVMMAQGFQPTIISNNAIAGEVAGFTTVSDAFGYIYSNFRHQFYVLTFPSASRTFVFDITTGTWHEWQTTGGRHLSNTHSFFNGKHIVGDFQEGKLYELDYDTYKDAGKVITRIRRSPHIHTEDRPAFHRAVEVEIESGVGNSNDATPEAMLSWSDDGGYTWSNEYWRSMGKIGEYRQRMIWRKLGRTFDRVYELKITDAVKPIVINAYADLNISEDDMRT